MSHIAHQYLELTKPRVVALIVFTAVIGMFLAVPGMVPLRPLIAGTIGIWLAAASAAAINHLIDQRIDKLMARTSQRPLATGALNADAGARVRGHPRRAVDDDPDCIRQSADRRADVRLADRLRGRLHRVPEARDAAEHRHRRHRRRRAAGARLGGGHRQRASVRAAALS